MIMLRTDHVLLESEGLNRCQSFFRDSMDVNDLVVPYRAEMQEPLREDRWNPAFAGTRKPLQWKQTSRHQR